MQGFCLGLFLIAALIVCVVGVILVWNTLAGEPNEIRTNATLDRSIVPVNEPFTLTVELENVALEPVTIKSVGLEDDLLEGARVTDVQPVFRAADVRSFPLVGDWTEYPLDRRLLGGSGMTVMVTLQAVTPGAYSGDVSIWVEGELLGITTARARRETIEFEVVQ